MRCRVNLGFALAGVCVGIRLLRSGVFRFNNGLFICRCWVRLDVDSRWVGSRVWLSRFGVRLGVGRV